MKVLFIHMTGAFGGSSRSLSEAVRALRGKVDAHFITPRGTVEKFFGQLGKVLPVRGLSQFDNTRYSYYRGFRWLVLLREVFLIPATTAAIYRAHRKWPDIDLIHINEFTGLLPWWLARRLYRLPVVVHVRSVARNEKKSMRTNFVNAMFRNNAESVVAIDETVRASLPNSINVDVIHNAFTPKPVNKVDDQFVGSVNKLRPESYKVGFVGNLLKVKGIEDLIEAARIVTKNGVDVEFMIIGDDARPSTGLRVKILNQLGLNQNIRTQVEASIRDYGLTDRVHFFGFMADIAQAYQYMDVLCFPSHFDAPGRPVFEAAFSKVPSIVAVKNPTSDTLIDGETGLAIPSHAPDKLAEAITLLAQNRELSKKMGEKAFKLAKNNFDVETNATKLYAVFQRCLEKSKKGEVNRDV